MTRTVIIVLTFFSAILIFTVAILLISEQSLGDSIFYWTTVDYRMVPVIVLPNLARAAPGWAKTSYLSGERPIPFPPKDVWCILLKGESQPQQIVFVALHQGLYNADSLVHERSSAKMLQN